MYVQYDAAGQAAGQAPQDDLLLAAPQVHALHSPFVPDCCRSVCTAHGSPHECPLFLGYSSVTACTPCGVESQFDSACCAGPGRAQHGSSRRTAACGSDNDGFPTRAGDAASSTATNVPTRTDARADDAGPDDARADDAGTNARTDDAWTDDGTPNATTDVPARWYDDPSTSSNGQNQCAEARRYHVTLLIDVV